MSLKRIQKIGATTAVASALCVAATTASAETMNLRMATPWSGGHWMDVGAQGFAEAAELLTEGRIKIEVYPAGTLGEALKVTESVRRGVADVGHQWPSYDWGVDKTGVLFGGWSGGLSGEESLLWLHNGGGAELLAEWRMEVSDVVSFPCGTLESEIYLHTHEAVRSVADHEGLKVRTSGAWAEIAPKLGASTVIMPGGEVFSALERGIVDGIEWGGPGVNLPVGFHDIAKYIVLPGIHAPGGVHECLFNKEVWAQISEKDQELLRQAGKLTQLNSWLQYAQNDLEAFQVLENSEQNEIVQLDDEFLEAARQASEEWAEPLVEENEWFARVYESQKAYEEMLTRWPEFRPAIGVR